MEHYNTIGNIISTLRNSKNLSQEQLANLTNVSRSVIAKIETGNRTPTEEQLILLSNKLNFDLISFTNNIHNYKTLEHYLLAYELMKLINKNNISSISDIIDENSIFSELNYGEPMILKIYCETIVQIQINKNIDFALSSCIDFFNIKKLDLSNFTPKINMPNQYYSMILNLGFCLNQIKDCSNAILLYNSTIDFFENLYFNDKLPLLNVDNFYRKYYIILLNNLADTYFNSDDYINALSICTKAIDKSKQLNILNILPMLVKLKVELQYNLGELAISQETYIDFKSICRLTNNMSYFESSTDTFQTKYLNLF